jgi:hypothetical protein
MLPSLLLVEVFGSLEVSQASMHGIAFGSESERNGRADADVVLGNGKTATRDAADCPVSPLVPLPKPRIRVVKL